MKVLVLSCSLDTPGGVAAFIGMLVRRGSSEVAYEHFSIGARPDGSGGVLALLRPLIDGLHLFTLLRRNHFDVVHLNPSLNAKSLLRDGFFLALIHCLGIRNSLVFFHGWSLATQETILAHRPLRRLFRKVFAGAGMIGVLSGKFRLALLKMGFAPENIHVFSTMFEGVAVEPAGTRGRPPKKNNARLLFMSRLVKGKGCRETLQAFRLLANRYPEIELVVAGDGPERDTLIDWRRRWKLTEKVSFPGYLRASQKADALKKAGILLFPTYYGEGCPVIVLEAMACAMAIVTTGDGGLPDILEQGKNALLLPDSDPLRIAVAVEALLSDRRRLEAMQMTNHRYAWDCFEAGVVNGRIQQAYRTVMAAGGNHLIRVKPPRVVGPGDGAEPDDPWKPTAYKLNNRLELTGAGD